VENPQVAMAHGREEISGMTKSPQRPPPIVVQTIYVDVRVPVTYVRGEIDMSTDEFVQNEVTAVLATKPRLLVLDLTQVAFMGSAGVRLVLRNNDNAHALGSALAVVTGGGYARRVLTLSGVTEVLPLYWDVPTALRVLA
jgi:anti-sigma B factor antagonist